MVCRQEETCCRSD
jgi:methylmalonyl-CoA/ethylmalonyl-CoA epimerase